MEGQQSNWKMNEACSSSENQLSSSSSSGAGIFEQTQQIFMDYQEKTNNNQEQSNQFSIDSKVSCHHTCCHNPNLVQLIHQHLQSSTEQISSEYQYHVPCGSSDCISTETVKQANSSASMQQSQHDQQQQYSLKDSCFVEVNSEKEINSSKRLSESDQQFMNGACEEDDEKICELLSKAQQEKEDSKFVDAEQTYFNVLELQRQKHGQASIQLASTFKKLASMFQKIRDFDASLKYYTEALAIFTSEDVAGVHCSREATCLISISNLYLAKEDMNLAKEFVTRAIQIYNTQTLEDEQMKPLLISQALRLKRKIDQSEKQKQFEENQIKFSNEQTTCSICLDDIQQNKRIRQLTCGHKFHIKCIAEWLQQNPKCPYCRGVSPKAC